MQKIILFIEPNDEAFMTPAKIGDIFMNRFAIDENATCEILKRFELGKTTAKISYSNHKDSKTFAAERQQKGMYHFIVIGNTQILMLSISPLIDPFKK